MSKPTVTGRSRSRRSQPKTAEPGAAVRTAPTGAARASTSIHVGILGFDGVTALDLVGPAEAFSIASEVVQSRDGGLPPYQITVLGLTGLRFVAESGLRFEAHALLEAAPPPDTLIVPGGRGLREHDATARLASWLRANAQACRRVASVCTGIYGLPSSGLLDGRRVATHWRFARDVAQRFPKLSPGAYRERFGA